MNREQLQDIATRYIEFINTPDPTPDLLSQTTAQDVDVKIPYPGSTPDFAGLLATTAKIHAASPNFKMILRETVIDETQSTVVCLLNATGTQEWLGIPPTGKNFNTLGYMEAKINPSTGLVSETSMIFQDLLFLQQVGVMPAGPPPS